MDASRSKSHKSHLARPADDRVVSSPKNIDFRANPEGIEVEARLNREAGPRQDAPLVMRLIVIQMNAVSMHGLAEAVTRAVKDVVTVARPLENAARGSIDFPAVQLPSCHSRLFDERHCGVARATNRIERAGRLVWHA